MCIKKALNSLIGLPLQKILRAADMRMFSFGKIIPREGGSAYEFALHLLCSWRLLGAQGIVTGHRDLWEPIHEDDWDEKWDYEENGNLQDEQLGKLKKGLIVEEINIKEYGDLEILFSQGYKLETFLNHTRGDSWLFFQPGDLESFIEMDQTLSSSILLKQF